MLPIKLIAQQTGRQAKHVGIVVQTADLGRHQVVAGNCTDTGHFVGGNAHPQARAANQYAAIDLPRRHQVRNTRGNLRVVDWMAIGNAPVDNFMPQPANHFDQHCPHKVSAVICTDGDTHGNETFLILFPLTDQPNRCVQTSCRAWAAGRYSVSLPDKTGNETAILDPAYAEQVCQGGHLCLKRKQHSPAERAD